MSTNIPIGECMTFTSCGETELFRAVLEIQTCPTCSHRGYGLMVVGVAGAWWICGACNAFEAATAVQPAPGPKLRRVK